GRRTDRSGSWPRLQMSGWVSRWVQGERRSHRTGVVLGGCSSMVEPQPSKLMGWVGFPSPAPLEGSPLLSAHVAQLVEHVLGKDEVSGSIPLVSSRRDLLSFESV